MMPGQLNDSLTSHRLSLMMPTSGTAAGARSHRLSLMPGLLPPQSLSSAQLRSPSDSRSSCAEVPTHLTPPSGNETSRKPLLFLTEEGEGQLLPSSTDPQEQERAQWPPRPLSSE